MSELIGDRVRAVRESRGEKQPAFAATLTAAAKRLGIAENYDNTMVSKMEIGRRDVGLNDVIVIASVDRKKRGREWLAWGDSPERVLLDPTLDRGLSLEEESRALRDAEDAKAERKNRGKGTRRVARS